MKDSGESFHDKTVYNGDKVLEYEVKKLAKMNKFSLDHEALAMLAVTNSTRVYFVIMTLMFWEYLMIFTVGFDCIRLPQLFF